MSDYKTVKGREIIAGKLYKTRAGGKAFISHSILGYAAQQVWHINKYVGPDKDRNHDLMRLWKQKKDHIGDTNKMAEDEQTLLQCVREQYLFATGSECEKVIVNI